MIGKTISHYKIINKLGEGGMGVVYRAKDTKLDREVALKFLPANQVGAGEDQQRFEQEAKAAAKLSHANIATVFEINEHEGLTFIAMEYIDGETLSDLVQRRPLKIKDAIKIARQIAEGLHSAHEQGIVHRDIKSANIMITAKGAVKIMDFGLAKLSKASMLTKAGTTLGTISYMSPEQTQGEKVDHRSDIWSLGVVLYEMVSGQLPFKGDYESAIIYSIMNEKPEPLTAVRTGVPMDLEKIVNKLLAKEPGERYQNIVELPVDLKNVSVQDATTARIGSSAIAHSISQKKELNVKISYSYRTILTIIATAILTFLLTWVLKPELPSNLAANLPIQFNVPIEASGEQWGGLAISPDGMNMAYMGPVGIAASIGISAATTMKLRRMDEVAIRNFPGLEGMSVSIPFFSPDGEWLGFFDWENEQLKKIAIGGGRPTVICEANSVWGAHWGANGTIIFGSGEGDLMQVPASGGVAETAVEMSPDTLAKMPFILPGGKAVLFSTYKVGSPGSDVMIASLANPSEAPRVLIDNASQPRYVKTDHIFYIQAGALMAAPFNLRRLEITGAAKMVFEKVSDGPRYRGYSFALADNGAIMYLSGRELPLRLLVWVDPHQNTREPVGMPERELFDPNISPSGNRLVFAVREGGSQSIWTWDIGRNTPSRVTTANRMDMAPVWTPDGQSILFTTLGNYLMSKAADGTGAEDSLYEFTSRLVFPYSWSVDGRTLAVSGGNIDFIQFKNTKRGGLAIAGEPVPYVSGDHNAIQPQFSPDGHWLAYSSNESGNRSEIYVQPLQPSSLRRWQASNNGGQKPRWSHDGRELYYRHEDKMMVVRIQLEPKFSATEPEVLFEGDYLTIGGVMDYDVAADGRFLMIEGVDADVSQINVAVNWFEKLKRLVPVEKN